MDRESMRRLMDLIDDSDIKETMNRVSDNLDRVERMKAQRKNPDAQKTRAREICSAAASLPVPLPDTGMVSPAGSDVSKGAPLPAALILTGGGAKASFQAGACKILEENGLFDRGQIAVSSSINARLYLTKSVGCSITYPCRLACTDVIGSINACLYLTKSVGCSISLLSCFADPDVIGSSPHQSSWHFSNRTTPPL